MSISGLVVSGVVGPETPPKKVELLFPQGAPTEPRL